MGLSRLFFDDFYSGFNKAIIKQRVTKRQSTCFGFVDTDLY
jgi:hypothetical protein